MTQAGGGPPQATNTPPPNFAPVTALSADGAIAQQLILPWDDLKAQRIPEDYLHVSRDVVPTLAVGVGMGPTKPKLLTTDGDGRLKSIARIGALVRAAVASAGAQAVIQLPDTSDFAPGDLVRILNFDVNGATLNDMLTDVLAVSSSALTVRDKLQGALNPGDYVQRVPPVQIQQRPDVLLLDRTLPQGVNQQFGIQIPAGTTALRYAELSGGGNGEFIQVNSPLTGGLVDSVTPTNNLTGLLDVPENELSATIYISTFSSNQGLHVQIFAVRSRQLTQVFTPTGRPINVSVLNTPGNAQTQQAVSVRFDSSPPAWQRAYSYASFAGAIAAAGTLTAIPAPAAGNRIYLHSFFMTIDVAAGAANSWYLRDASPANILQGSTGQLGPFRFEGHGAALPLATALLIASDVAITVRGGVSYSIGT